MLLLRSLLLGRKVIPIVLCEPAYFFVAAERWRGEAREGELRNLHAWTNNDGHTVLV